MTCGQASGCEYLGEVLDKCVVRMDVWVLVSVGEYVGDALV